jgi:transcriptional regulator with XRE-family HTH domain
MSDPTKNWKKIITKVPVKIPTLDGKGIAETVEVEVNAYQNPADGEIYLDGEALEMLDNVKARHMGLLLPDGIRKLRERLDLTQKEISELLQIGEKTWTRWETGRERPSRSMNLLLQAVYDGKVDAQYMRIMRDPSLREKPLQVSPRRVAQTFAVQPHQICTQEKNNESVSA